MCVCTCVYVCVCVRCLQIIVEHFDLHCVDLLMLEALHRMIVPPKISLISNNTVTCL